MRRTRDDRPPGLRTRSALAVSLLAGAGLVAVAFVAPGWLAGTPAPAPPAPAPIARPADAELLAARNQAGLVQQEDDRLIAQLRGAPWYAEPFLDREHGPQALVLTPRRSPYDLDALIRMGAATRVDPGTVELTSSVLVAPGATLAVTEPDTTLRMRSEEGGFTSLVGWKGNLVLGGAPDRPLRVTSWDPKSAAPDLSVADGRAYVRVVGAQLETRDAELSDLGFWSGRTGGVALTGSDGISAGGSIVATTMHRNHYGLFSSDTDKLTVTGSTVVDSTVDGVLLHRGSVGATVEKTVARGSGGHGIAVGQGTAAVTLRAVEAVANSGDGIRVDGRPQAEQAGPAGLSLDAARGFGVLESTSTANVGSGILVWDADDVSVTGNVVADNPEGIVVRGTAEGVRVDGNTVTGSTGAAVAVTGGAVNTVVEHNTISGAHAGVLVRDAVAAVNGNTVGGARSHALSFQGAANGSSAGQNVLAGQGPSSVDVLRVVPGASVAVGVNDDAGWQVVKDRIPRLTDLFSSHPLLLMWAALFLLPVVATLLARRRRRNRGSTAPYPTSPDRGAVPPGTGIGPRAASPAAAAGTPGGAAAAGSDTRVTVVGVR
jgi:parallel beta-helix repeat protein